MNIFVLDSNPERAARYHCDRHVVKMVLETAQLMSTVLWQRLPEEAVRLAAQGLVYRPAHPHHPCTVWAGTNHANFTWLARLGTALAAEYRHRYERDHKSRQVIEAVLGAVEAAIDRRICNWGAPGRRSPFAQVMPDEYRAPDAVAAYRSYYGAEKAAIARWTRRSVPRWFRLSACQSQRHVFRNAESLGRQ